MSAFAGLEITDAEVEVTGGELPAMGGCSRGYVEALEAAGYCELDAVEAPGLFKRAFVQERSAEIAIAKGGGHWRYEFVTESRWPREQIFEATDVLVAYREQIAPARTFTFAEDVQPALAAGLGKGLDAESVLILGEDGYDSAARFADEPARHKMLDLIGDLYLAGVPIRFLSVVAQRSGHRLNVQAAAKLAEFIGS